MGSGLPYKCAIPLSSYPQGGSVVQMTENPSPALTHKPLVCLVHTDRSGMLLPTTAYMDI